MDEALNSINFIKVINAVYKNLRSIQSAALTEDYPGVNWFKDTDDNYVSATIHHMISAFTCVELNFIITMTDHSTTHSCFVWNNARCGTNARHTTHLILNF